MEQKGIPTNASDPNRNIGFDVPPPAYSQYQDYRPQYPAQPTYPQAQPQVIHVISGNIFGPEPACLSCPSCKVPIQTRVDYETAAKTHLMAGLICLLFWPCFCLPYMIDSCKNANHYCPNCGSYLGSFRGS